MEAKKFSLEQFEVNRPHLRAVACRILGSLSDAEDAVQETWLRLSKVEVGKIANLGGWLTTTIGRICLDMLRSRKARLEEPLDGVEFSSVVIHEEARSPEDQIAATDSIGLALFVVIEKLAPAERLAFVLHDVFAVSYEGIAPVVGRSVEATRQLASRARRRVQGPPIFENTDRAKQRKLVEAFLEAARGATSTRFSQCSIQMSFSGPTRKPYGSVLFLKFRVPMRWRKPSKVAQWPRCQRSWVEALVLS